MLATRRVASLARGVMGLGRVVRSTLSLPGERLVALAHVARVWSVTSVRVPVVRMRMHAAWNGLLKTL